MRRPVPAIVAISQNPSAMSDTQLPGVFADVQPVLEHYGYLAVGGFVLLEDFGVPVPGEILLISAAIFAGAGQLNIALVIAVAVLGAVIGDNIGYAVGRLGGRPLAERWGRFVFLTPARLDRAETFFNAHGGKVVTVARFIEGLRQLNGLLAGIADNPHAATFLDAGVVLGVLAVGLMAFAGTHMAVIYAEFERYRWYAIGILVLVAGVCSQSACGVDREAPRLVVCMRDSPAWTGAPSSTCCRLPHRNRGR
jgi:membrane protein DedA with SNARE-associated domain